MSRLSDELKRLEFTDLYEAFIFGVDFGYYDSDYVLNSRCGPIWMNVSSNDYKLPVLHNDTEREDMWLKSENQKSYVNNRRYPNKCYVTLTSKHKRRLCRNGCLYVFDKSVIGRTIYVTFGINCEFLGADFIEVSFIPTVFDRIDLDACDADNINIAASGITIELIPDEAPRLNHQAYHAQGSISYHRPNHTFGSGSWTRHIYHLVPSDNNDDRFYTTDVRSEIVNMDHIYQGCKCRRILDPIPVSVANISKVLLR